MTDKQRAEFDAAVLAALEQIARLLSQMQGWASPAAGHIMGSANAGLSDSIASLRGMISPTPEPAKEAPKGRS